MRWSRHIASTTSVAGMPRGFATTMPVGSSGRESTSNGSDASRSPRCARSARRRWPTVAPSARWTASVCRSPTKAAASTVPVSKRDASSFNVMLPSRSIALCERQPRRSTSKRSRSRTQSAPTPSGP